MISGAPVGKPGAVSSSARAAAIRVAEIAFLIAMPVVLFAAYRISPLNQAGYLDPYFYTGYIHNIRDLVDRYGFPYYSVRFGLILPARFLGLAFGWDRGYLIFRYLLALTAGIPIYLFARKLFGRAAASALYCALLTSPVLDRSLFWDHPDAAGLPYLLGAAGLFLLESGSLCDAFAGALFGLALHSNFFTGSITALFLACYAAATVISRRGLGALILRLFWAGAGVVAVTAAGIVYYKRTLGLFNIFFPTLEISRWLSNGGMQQWRVAGTSWISGNYHVLMLPVAAIYVLIAARARSKRVELWTLQLYILSVAAYFYLYQFRFHGDILQLPYYFTYGFPAIFLGIVLVLDRLWNHAPQTYAIVTALLLGFCAPWLIGIYVKNWFAWVHLRQFLELSVITGIVLAVCVSVRGRLRPAAAWFATVALGTTLAAGFSESTFTTIFNGGSPTERSLYRVSEQFLNAMPAQHDLPGRVCFWYTNRAGSLLNSLQSTYLWGLSRCSSPLDTTGGMPAVDESAAKRFREPDLAYIALLAESEPQHNQALASLAASNIRVEEVKREVLSSGTLSVYFSYLKVLRNTSPEFEKGKSAKP